MGGQREKEREGGKEGGRENLILVFWEILSSKSTYITFEPSVFCFKNSNFAEENRQLKLIKLTKKISKEKKF